MIAGEGQNSENGVDTSVLNNLNPTGQASTLLQDINNYTPQNLSPEQQQAFQSQYTPTTGALASNTYYPDINHNIGVGNYSGSEIGSTTLFAPGGGLVPLGLLDARDAAVQHAALKKAKDEDDFRKAYQSPTTKHVAVQKNLTDAYMNGLKQWNQNALKKSGGNQALANKMLEQDPNFQGWNKSMQDTSKYHDAIVEHAAQLHADEKDPNFVISPETRKATSDLLSGAAYQGQDPFNPQARNMESKYLGAHALYDLDKSTNTAIDKAIPNIEQLPPEYTGRGKNEIATYLEKEYFKPEQIDQMAHTVYNEKYAGTDIPYEAVKKSIESKLGEKIKRKTDTYDKYYKPDPPKNDDVDYSNSVVEKSEENNTSPTGEVGSTLSEHYVPANVVDQSKKLKVAISSEDHSMNGSDINTKAGNVEGTVQGFAAKLYDKKAKRFLNKDEADKITKLISEGKAREEHNLEWKSAAIFNVSKSDDDEGPPESIYMDPKKFAGVFSKKNKKGKDLEDMRIETEQYAANKNKELKNGSTDKIIDPGKNPGVNKKALEQQSAKKVEDLRKKYNY